MNRRQARVLIVAAIVVLWALVFIASGWLFWPLAVIAVIVTCYVVGLYIYRNSSPWRRIYFPLIQRYAFLGGAHVRLADMAQTKFTPRKPLGVLLREFQPAFTDEQIERILDKWQSEFEDFDDADLFQQIFQESGIRSEDMSEKLNKLHTAMIDPQSYNSCFVRHAIGQIIHAKVGIEQKKQYWHALLFKKVS